MQRPLYLDDIRTPTTDKDWVICRTVEEAKNYCLTNGVPIFCSFDHDLGENDAPTGYDFAKWLTEVDMNWDGGFIPDNFTYNIHSANPVGAANIRGILDGYMRFRSR